MPFMRHDRIRILRSSRRMPSISLKKASLARQGGDLGHRSEVSAPLCEEGVSWIRFENHILWRRDSRF